MSRLVLIFLLLYNICYGKAIEHDCVFLAVFIDSCWTENEKRLGRLDGKVAIVTGAGQGLGAAIVKKLAGEGAKIVATGRTLEKVERMHDNLKAEMPECEVIPVYQDVASKESWNDVVHKTIETFGKLDIVVNNAAIFSRKNILNCSEEDFIKLFRTNTLAVAFSVQTAVPEMEKVGGGSIVNIDSIGGMTSGAADGGDAAYSTSKGGTCATTKHCSYQLAEKKIRVHTIHTSAIMTPPFRAYLESSPDKMDSVKKNAPLPPHIAEPEDIANGVLFLASDESRCVTGAELVIDCGYMTH